MPFGDGYTAIAGPDQDAYHFAGLDGDADGTMHAQFRNYQPATAQWLSPDPYAGSYSAWNPQSFNRYAYVLNNPVLYVDRTGLIWDCGGATATADNPVLNFLFGWIGCLIGGDPGGGDSETGGAFGSENGSFGGGVYAVGLESGGGDGIPSNANTNLVLFAGFPPQPGPSTAGLYQVYWHIQALRNGQVEPHYSPTTGLYAPTYRGVITLQEDQADGKGFRPTGEPQHDTAIDNIYVGKVAPFYQKWFIGGQQVQVVVGGTY